MARDIPEGNQITRNVFQGEQWLEIGGDVEKYLQFANNSTRGARFDGLQPASSVQPAGFQPIPLNKIGLIDDEYRRLLSPD